MGSSGINAGTWGHTLSCSVTDTTGSQSHSMMQITLRVAFLATVSLAAPAADADADPFYGYGGYAPYVAHAPYVHAPPVVVPVCKIITKTVVVGKSCHAEPECSTKSVVVGKAVTGVEDPVCEDVETVVPAVVPHAYHSGYGKRDAEADPHYGYGLPVAHPVAVTTKVTTKHCTPGAPILEDISRGVTTCVPKEVCTDVEAPVHETVCGEPEAAAEE